MTEYFFGLRIATVGPVWGARAIDTKEGFDLVWDRKQAEGSMPEIHALCHWLDTYALDRLRRECLDLHDGPPHNALTFADRGFVLHARRRGGYFYIGACREEHYQPGRVNSGV